MATDVRCGSSLCENSLEPRTRRIVFSIAFSQEKSPVQSVSTTTKLRQKFYAQVQRRSFHTAWVINGPDRLENQLPLYPRKRTPRLDYRAMSEKCHERTSRVQVAQRKAARRRPSSAFFLSSLLQPDRPGERAVRAVGLNLVVPEGQQRATAGEAQAGAIADNR